MTPLYKTSDWHLGVIRSAGTRPDTAYQLRQDLLREFEEMLYNIVTDGDLILNGDLFDGPAISMADLAQTFAVLSDWLVRTGKKLWLPNGNHDLSKNSTNFSSYQFLAKLLSDQFPDQVTHIVEGTDIGNGCYVLPHVTNQDILEIELKKVPACDYLFVHANFANVFAQEADHSLSISEDQIRALPAKIVVFSHEHIGRIEMRGRVVIVGNARPSSISDCLGNTSKRMVRITDAGLEFIETWKADGDYIEMPWNELQETGARFVRAVGTATADQAAAVVTAIARFRAQSPALIVGNAVKVEGVNNAEELALSVEQITSFNVRAALAELLTPEENAKLEALNAASDQN
jgi:hypothetical protein